MPEKILRAVAVPPTLFWAPQLPAAINMAIHALVIVFGWSATGISPLAFIASFLLVHGLIAGQGAKEPHLSTVISAWAVTKRGTKNLIKSKTRKYVP